MSIFLGFGRSVQILSLLKDAVWGVPTLALVLVFGIYFTFKSGFFRFRTVGKIASDLVSSLKSGNKDGISPLNAVATALGGTVGVGSIVGVGLAISVGGAGSIFWMWVCSFFGMGLKYAEVKISLNKRRNVGNKLLGGAHIRLFDMGYKMLSVLFCIFCVLCSFGTGNLTQVGAISSFLASLGMKKQFSAVVCVLLISLAVFGGRTRIAKVNTFLVPISSAVYILVCAVIIAMNIENVPSVFSEIIGSAFGFSSIAGGFSGAVVSKTLREGFVRSIFSNEAGMGSSSLAHASADTENVGIQAEWGIFEIFFDTFIVSTLTAFCLLSAKSESVSFLFSSVFGAPGFWLFGILSAVFAFASVISWCFYAECCLSFLFKKSDMPKTVYRILFSLSAVFGVFLSVTAIWEIADILNALMMIPNMFLMYRCRNEIERIN